MCRLTLTVTAGALLGLNPRNDPFLMTLIAAFSLGHLTKASQSDFFCVFAATKIALEIQLLENLLFEFSCNLAYNRSLI